MEKLDQIDFKILSYLQEHGRVTNVALADAVGLSTSPCLSRVKKLETLGYIKSYGARIALEMLGEYVTVFTEIKLTGHRVANFERFLQRARNIREIVECHHVTGGYDYLVKIVARNVSHYHGIMESLLLSDAGIGKFSSYIVLGTPIIREGYPIEELF
ncbi:DNA-binding Lrp family transcriptional regulator [Novosphingobium sp. SG751A]|uniref:Lrp/AsnC family transcriptional regulator n=1 Tax=Novosphingobium sp. SG751A TaxID=2587000 RepID=UPI001556669F|nr:Lrp/AsnC family transcriptional regulator [Novosphingobium sp. SG751A]NOW48538.1 DNA-binding Lrp family transcriptional regulator [Novosphingobium sp. SG751A]